LASSQRGGAETPVPDRPTKRELLGAVRSFLEQELMPELEGVKRFHARVASNVLAIVSREIEREEPMLRGQHQKLAELLDETAPPPPTLTELALGVERLEAELARRIRAGEADASPRREQVLEYLAGAVRERLAISNPSYR